VVNGQKNWCNLHPSTKSPEQHPGLVLFVEGKLWRVKLNAQKTQLVPFRKVYAKGGGKNRKQKSLNLLGCDIKASAFLTVLGRKCLRTALHVRMSTKIGNLYEQSGIQPIRERLEILRSTAIARYGEAESIHLVKQLHNIKDLIQAW
jgi:hypothetical protein